MKIFHPQSHSLHAPAWYLADGSIRPCPETPARVENVLAAIQEAGIHECVSVPLIEELLPAITTIHAPDYLEYLQGIHKRWHKEFNTDVLPDTFPRPNAYHPRSKSHPQPGDYCFDLAAPITAGTWLAAVNSVYCAIAAAHQLLSTESSRGANCAYALCRPPGHHAGADYCGGFCYLNNIAIAAQHLLNAGQKKIAILDIDYHHGNGTQDVFYQRNDVLFISIHADPETQYPYFWGHADQIGKEVGEGFNLNLPLPRNAPAKRWFSTLETAIGRIQQYHPDALLISLGADIHHTDPVGDFQLTTEDFTTIAQKLRALDLPTAIIQEGGYNLTHIGHCVTAALHGFAD